MHRYGLHDSYWSTVQSKRVKKIIASILIRILASTWRITLRGKLPAQPAVIAFWHGGMLPVWKYFSRSRPVGVTSQSKDGDILAALLESWNYTVLRGSSSKGGSEVLQQMVEHAQQHYVLVTPDGPRGPALQFKPGAVVCAQRAEVPVCVIRVECSRAKHLHKSWDNFMIPLPFAEVIITVQQVLTIPTTATREDVDEILVQLSESTGTPLTLQ